MTLWSQSFRFSHQNLPNFLLFNFLLKINSKKPSTKKSHRQSNNSALPMAFKKDKCKNGYTKKSLSAPFENQAMCIVGEETLTFCLICNCSKKGQTSPLNKCTMKNRTTNIEKLQKLHAYFYRTYHQSQHLLISNIQYILYFNILLKKSL